MKRWTILVVILVIIVLILYLRWNMIYNKVLTFIMTHNPLAPKIAKAVMKYRGFFPAELVTALIYGESGFDPNVVGRTSPDDKGLGQLSPIMLREIELYYGIEVDRTRIFEIDYNLYLACLALKRCKIAARSKAKEEGLYLYYATLLTYKDWLTWTEWTYTKADRTWEVYNELRYGYQRYGSKVGDVRYVKQR